jgi:hypothetical protein
MPFSHSEGGYSPKTGRILAILAAVQHGSFWLDAGHALSAGEKMMVLL